MNSNESMSLSSGVILFTQIVKWAGLPDRYGPFSVMIFSAAAVVLWTISVVHAEAVSPLQYVTSWLSIASSAAGVFGFTRAASTAITATTSPPPGGAGGNVTVKISDEAPPRPGA